MPRPIRDLERVDAKTKMKSIGHGGKRDGSGRKRGTPNKITQTVKQYAAQFGTEAIDKLVAIMRDASAPHTAQIASAKELLDRGFGKPSISIDVAEIKISQIPWDDLREITRQAVEKAEKDHKEFIEGRYERLGIKKEYHSD